MTARLLDRLVGLELTLIRIRDGLYSLPGSQPRETIALLASLASDALDGDLGLRAAIAQARDEPLGPWLDEPL